MPKLKIKVCGMREAKNIKAVAALRPDFMGFIFVKSSPRFVGDNFEAANLYEVESATKTVAVFSNHSSEVIINTVNKYKFKAVQLHGDEKPEDLSKIKSACAGLEIIKSFSVNKYFDFKSTVAYQTVADYLLFDTASDKGGGSGTTFDWSMLEQYRGHRPYLLAGGIAPEHCTALRHLSAKLNNFVGIDLNSKFETAPAQKSVTLLGNFIKEVRV